MDKLDFPPFLESTGRELEARIKRAHFYQHPTGTGDAREDIVRQYRYYKPLLPFQTVDSAVLAAGFPPQDNRVGQVWSGIIAFDAPNGETLTKYIERCCEGFWFICVPDREFAYLNPPGWRGAPYGLKSLPLLIWLIMDLVSNNPRPSLFRPDFSRYRSRMINAIGNLTGGWEAKLKEMQGTEDDSAA